MGSKAVTSVLTYPERLAVLVLVQRALHAKVREINTMGKLAEAAARVKATKEHLDAEADKLTGRLDELDAKAPAAFERAHTIVAAQHADVDEMESELRQLANLPLDKS